MGERALLAVGEATAFTKQKVALLPSFRLSKSLRTKVRTCCLNLHSAAKKVTSDLL